MGNVKMVQWQMTLFVIVTRILSVAKGGNVLNYVTLVIIVSIRSHWNNIFLFALVLLNMIMESIAQTILVLKLIKKSMKMKLLENRKKACIMWIVFGVILSSQDKINGNKINWKIYQHVQYLCCYTIKFYMFGAKFEVSPMQRGATTKSQTSTNIFCTKCFLDVTKFLYI